MGQLKQEIYDHGGSGITSRLETVTMCDCKRRKAIENLLGAIITDATECGLIFNGPVMTDSVLDGVWQRLAIGKALMSGTFNLLMQKNDETKAV